MTTTKLTTTSNTVNVNVNGESTRVTTSSSKIQLDVKPNTLSVSLARVGPQGAIPKVFLNDLQDIDLTGAVDGDGLRYEATSNEWKPHTFSTSSLSDIDNSTRANGSLLIYDNSSTKYVASNSIEDNMTIKGGTF